MTFPISTTSLQARLAALGFHPGYIDGVDGPRTQAATREAMKAFTVSSPRGLFHKSGLHREHWHWVVGHDGVTDDERKHYHFIYDDEGQEHAGLYPPEANVNPRPGRYAAHTYRANTGAIGSAVDAMAGAVERPFSWGSNPMTNEQLDAMLRGTAKRCVKYWIPVSPYSTLSHSEVQPTLGIKQRGKWDINVIPGMDAPGDPVEVGNELRDRVRHYMRLFQ